MKVGIVVLIAFLISSCGIDREWEMEKLQNFLTSNLSEFERLRLTFEETSLKYMRLNYDRELVMSDSAGQRKYPSTQSYLSEPDAEYSEMIGLMQKLDVNAISGKSGWFLVGLEDSPCGQVYYREESGHLKDLFEKYNDKSAVKWAFLLHGKWYFEKEPCFD